MIIAPAEMTAAKDQKVAAQKCFDACQLDPDMYRIGHTKARIKKKIPLNVDFFFVFKFFFFYFEDRFLRLFLQEWNVSYLIKISF